MEIINGQLKFNEDELMNLTDTLAVIIGAGLGQFAALELNTCPLTMQDVDTWKQELVHVSETLLEEVPELDVDVEAIFNASEEMMMEHDDRMEEFLKRRQEAMEFFTEYFHVLWD